jgi:hypothetical protein
VYFCRHLSLVPLPPLKFELEELHAMSPAAAITGSAARAGAADHAQAKAATIAAQASFRNARRAFASPAAPTAILTPVLAALRRPLPTTNL